ncbi:MAG: AI-2E family transporter [Candidatus Eutrophobiaceae bacterium]
MLIEGKWLCLTVVAALGLVLMWKLSPILGPFLISAVFAYLGDPLVDWLERRNIGRNSAVVLVFVALLILVVTGLTIILPLVYDQVLRLIDRMPQIVDMLWTEYLLAPAMSLGVVDAQGVGAGVGMETLADLLKEHWGSFGGVLGIVFRGIGQSGQAVLLALSYVLIVPVVTFYALRDWDKFLSWSLALVPRRFQAKISEIATECDSVLGSFLRGQLWVMFALAVIYSAGLAIAGIEFALLVGAFAGVISFVPYLGGILGVVVAAAIAAFQYQDIIHIVYVLVVFGVGQALEGMVLTPLLVGDRVGIHPLVVIFAVMAGGQLFGFSGILLALPMAAILAVLLRRALQYYCASSLHS